MSYVTRVSFSLLAVLFAASSLVHAASTPPVPTGEPAASPALAEVVDDPYRWLEEIDSERAMAWVREQNRKTAERLESQPIFEELHEEALRILNAESRIPMVTPRGEHLYNFWKDDEHPRGVYRRTTLQEYRQEDPRWETVIDIDRLAESEGTPWAFKGMDCLPPAFVRCLVALSPGGGDAVEIREFDAERLAFVDDGFTLPVAKSDVSWRDENSVYVATDFGEGSLTDSGYPRIVKLWRRGTPLAEATTLYEGAPSSVSVSAFRVRTDEGDIDLVNEQLTFWTGERYQLLDRELHELELPPSAVVEDGFRGRLIVSLKEDWDCGGESFERGQVVILDPAAVRVDAEAGQRSQRPEANEPGDTEDSAPAADEPARAARVEVLVDPAEGQVVEDVAAAESGILVTMLDDVRGRLRRFEPSPEGGWTARPIPFPDNGALHVTAVDETSGDAYVLYESFLTPPTLYLVADDSPKPVELKSQEPTFDASRFTVEQYWTESKDGTRIPYFVVMPKELERDGENPTHIFSYGGFRVSLTPSYSGSYEDLHGAYGELWLERGGVFVLANIRGGGEFGPAWHQAAVKEEHPRAFEDFEAVARDLVERGITSPEHLGIEGRSNGGLLVTATMARHPELYGAVVAGVPLTDMRRYHELLAGASWMAEYGDPDDPEQWEYLRRYSPYHNLDEEADYPPVFFYTSTRDDRVHPGHARKMAARMSEMGHDVVYYENIEGGHGGSVTNEQLAYRLALAYTHLWGELGAGEPERTRDSR